MQRHLSLAHDSTMSANTRRRGVGSTHNDTYTETRYRRAEGIGSKICNSIAGTLFGVVLIFGACYLIHWNEGRAIETARLLEHGEKHCTSLTNPTFNPELNHQLIHASGRLQSNQDVSDPELNIRGPYARLRRQVEMYQWVEHEHKRETRQGSEIREDITYSYTREWRGSRMHCKHSHSNPSQWMYTSQTWTDATLRLGDFSLSSILLDKLGPWQPVSLHSRKLPVGFMLSGNHLYQSARHKAEPAVGDIRIRYESVGKTRDSDATVLSVVGVQRPERGIEEYKTERGYSIALLMTGHHRKEQLFQAAHADNNATTWGLRAAGWILVSLGFGLTMSLINTTFGWIPLVGSLVSLATFLAALLLGTSLSVVTIALSWLSYRPLLGFALLVAAAIPLYLGKMTSSNN